MPEAWDRGKQIPTVAIPEALLTVAFLAYAGCAEYLVWCNRLKVTGKRRSNKAEHQQSATIGRRSRRHHHQDGPTA